MRITIAFQFNHRTAPAAVSGVEGDVTDIILPNVGDLVHHTDSGHPFLGKVTQRIFNYSFDDGDDVDGRVGVVLCLDHLVVN